MKKIKLNKCVCLRCKNVWFPRVEEVRMCARCKSVHWNTPANELPKMLKTKAKHRKLKNKAFNQKIANIIKNNN